MHVGTSEYTLIQTSEPTNKKLTMEPTTTPDTGGSAKKGKKTEGKNIAITIF